MITETFAQDLGFPPAISAGILEVLFCATWSSEVSQQLEEISLQIFRLLLGSFFKVVVSIGGLIIVLFFLPDFFSEARVVLIG